MASSYRDVKALMEKWGASEQTVLAVINSGELPAINIASRVGGRPRWRISDEAIAEFEASRTTTKPTPPAPRKRTNTQPTTKRYY